MASFRISGFYDRQSVIEHVKDSYGRNKKLHNGDKRNGSTIHYKCSNADCLFEIVYRKSKNSDGNDVFLLVEDQSFLKHKVILPTGETGICCDTKSTHSTVSLTVTIRCRTFYFISC